MYLNSSRLMQVSAIPAYNVIFYSLSTPNQLLGLMPIAVSASQPA